MSAVEVRDRLGDRFRLLTGPELRTGPPADPAARGGLVLRPAGRRRARGAAARRRCSRAASTCRRSAPSPGRATTSRCCGCSTRWCASPWSSPTTAPRGPGTACSRRSGRSPTSGSARPASATRPARPARRVLRGARRSARWERWNGPGWRDQVDWVQAELANLRSAFRWSVDRGHVEVATDVAAHAALMGFSVELFETIGWAEALLDGGDPGRRTAAPTAVRRGGVRLLRRAGRGRDRERPSRHRAGGATGLRVLRARLRDVHRGARTGLLREPGPLRRADPRRRGAARAAAGRTGSPRTSTGCSRRVGSTRRWSSPETAVDGGARARQPVLDRLHAVDRRVGLLEGGPAARAGDLGRGRGATSASTTSGSSRASWPATPRCCTPRTASWRRP